MAAFLVTVVWAAMAWYDFVPLLRAEDRDVRVCWIYGVLMAASYVVMLLVCFDVYTPSPVGWIESVIRNVFGM